MKASELSMNDKEAEAFNAGLKYGLDQKIDRRNEMIRRLCYRLEDPAFDTWHEGISTRDLILEARRLADQ